MKLLVIELQSELTQVVKPVSSEHVEAVRLHLYKHKNPSGKVFVQFRDMSNQLIAQSEKIEITTIHAEDYFHGQQTFHIKAHLKEQTEYKMVLCHEDYTFDESDYIGWCIDFDFNTYPKDYEFTSALKSAFDYEFWTRK